ncbi:unnamed protein product [Mortierella alpina]
MSHSRRITEESSELEDAQDYGHNQDHRVDMWNKHSRDEDFEMASAASTGFTLSIAVSDVDITSIASNDGASKGAVENLGGQGQAGAE